MNEDVLNYYEAVVDPISGSNEGISFEVVSVLYGAGDLPVNPSREWLDHFKDCVKAIRWQAYLSCITLAHALYKCKQHADIMTSQE